MNLYILLEIMEQRNVTKTELAKTINISPYTLRTRFRKKTSFTIDEINSIKEKLNLSNEQLLDIFFRDKVA